MTLDISSCDREPIRIPGKIQPHGIFIAVDSQTFQVTDVSENVSTHFIFKAQENLTADSIFKNGLAALIESQSLHQFLASLRNQDQKISNPVRLQLDPQVFTSDGQNEIDVIVHRSQESVLIEFEKKNNEAVSFSAVYSQIDLAIRSIEESKDLPSLFDESAKQIRLLTGFDRVMIYRFDAEWNGRVLAEAKKESMTSFLDLHFPASDIPKQARELYLTNWLRIIPDVQYLPANLLSVRSDPKPLDLTLSVLRSVSPVHIQYLKNMGIGASMSISVIRDGVLWGLVACHHESSLFVPYDVRQGCEFIGKFLSLQLAAKEKLQSVESRASKRSIISELEKQMKVEKAGNFLAALLGNPEAHSKKLFDLIEAEGVAVLYRGRVLSRGQTPLPEQIIELANWLRSHHEDKDVFATDRLAKLFEGATRYKKVASGVIAISVPEPEPTYVFWFRPEVIQTVKWSGSPEKSMEQGPQGPQLTPRHSFAEWRQTVDLRSINWDLWDIETAEELRSRINAVDLSRQVELEFKARRQAEQSNQALDEFAQIVSHDLRDPLRGIRYFASFVKQDESTKVSATSLENLTQIETLCSQMGAMIESLHQYSKLGQVDLAYGWVDLREVVHAVMSRFKHLSLEGKVEFVVDGSLPQVYCDRARIEEVFSNLISNAIKYNQSQVARVEIGADISKFPVEIYVADNGIGVSPANFAKIFQIFERLHPIDQFGGGTGMGLSLVERIVRKHGGNIAIESEEGQGSRFSFTLAPLNSVVHSISSSTNSSMSNSQSK